jgi:hypothetical protein
LVVLKKIFYFAIQSTLGMEEKYLNDISEIKKMMSKSSQFISLSGLAGIMAGVYALIGAFVANVCMNQYYATLGSSHAQINRNSYTFDQNELIESLFTIAISVLIASVLTAIIFTFFKAKKEKETIWNTTSKRLLFHFMIPLLTGGIFGLLLLKHQYYSLIAPITLIFYGLSCLNASKYTLRDVRYLGITIIILGLLSANYIGYGLEFWALGFGVCHILYGSLMYFKYDRK